MSRVDLRLGAHAARGKLPSNHKRTHLSSILCKQMPEVEHVLRAPSEDTDLSNVSKRAPSEDSDLSNVSTPIQKERMGGNSHRLRWSVSGEEFIVARGVDQREYQHQPVPVLEGRLYFMSMHSDPAPQHGIHFFTMDKVMRYGPFCAGTHAEKCSL
jgi:hypothetical protein